MIFAHNALIRASSHLLHTFHIDIITQAVQKKCLVIRGHKKDITDPHHGGRVEQRLLDDVHFRADSAAQIAQIGSQNPDGDVLFALEEVGGQAQTDPRLLRDFAHSGDLIPILQEQAVGDGQNYALFCLFHIVILRQQVLGVISPMATV